MIDPWGPGRRRVTTLELIAPAIAAPFLMFPSFRPVLTAMALVFIGGVWLYRWAAYGEVYPRTPFNGGLLLLAIMIPIAVWASTFPDLTLPKLAGLILAFATFRAFAYSFGTERALPWGLAALGLIGLGIFAAGLLTVNWPAKVPLFGSLVQHLPHSSILASFDVNANQLAGAMTVYLCVAAACAAVGLRSRRAGLAVPALVAAALAGALLVLTQSRGAWAGALIGLIALALLLAWTGENATGRRATVIASGVLLLALLAAAWRLGLVHLLQESELSGGNASAGGAVGSISVAARVEIWSRALLAIRDFPFTGVGLGAFREVVRVLYPLTLIDPGRDVGQAHNVYLQTALDVGLPGLIAYFALVEVGVVVAWKALRYGSALPRAAGAGLLAGLLALHIFSLADGLGLGSRPGITLWAALGLLAALSQIAPGAGMRMGKG